MEFCVRALCRARPKVSVAILDTSWKAVRARDLFSHAAYTYLHQLVSQHALNNGEQPGTLSERIRLSKGIVEQPETSRNPAIISYKEEVPGSSPGRPTLINGILQVKHDPKNEAGVYPGLILSPLFFMESGQQ